MTLRKLYNNSICLTIDCDEVNKFLVEFRHETNMRPVVVAIPQDKKDIDISLLKELQMLPHSHSSIS